MPQLHATMLTRGLCCTLAACALLLTACSREADDWRATQAADTVISYEQFLKQYPGSAHASDATTRVAQLAEDEAWQLATSQDTQAGYQQFVARYPEGKWAPEARVRIENFALTLPPADSPAAVMAGMAGTPAPARPVAPVTAAAPAVKIPPASAPVVAAPVVAAARPAPVAAPSVAAKPAAGEQHASGFGVQLGAYSSKDKAEAHWQQVSKQFKSALGTAKHQVVAGKGQTGKVYRLQLAQSGEAQARALCATLKAKGQACVVTHP
jgi:cell division septation protein DedD